MINQTVDFTTNSTLEVFPSLDTIYRIEQKQGTSEPKVLNIRLDKSDVFCKVVFSYQLHQDETLNLHIEVVHQAERTTCETIVRGVLWDGGVSNFQGKVVIKKSAQGSSSRLDDRTLVVGNGTRNHAEPLMQIEANDVTASHASSTGRIDRNELYYLKTRGLSTTEAQELLVDAFLNSTL